MGVRRPAIHPLSRIQALVLLVPSVVVPQERNALINVRHPGLAAVRLVGDDPFLFDPRLLNPRGASA